MDLTNAAQMKADRFSKGVAIADLVKVLKIYRRKCPLNGLSPAAEALLDEHILLTKWYSHESFLELLDTAYRVLLDSDEENALQMGINGGQVILQGIHSAFVQQGDPLGSVMALRHIWPTYYDFGGLTAELIDGQKVQFTVVDYPDITIPHAMVTVGWGIAAARLGGAFGARHEILERPWQGAPALKYRIDLDY